MSDRFYEGLPLAGRARVESRTTRTSDGFSLKQQGRRAMHLDSVGNILAERKLDLEEGGTQRQIAVLIGVPQNIPGSADCYCPYQIVGLKNETVRYTEGVDAAQALYLAMEAVGSLLAATTESRSGRLTWYGDSALGFPVREQRPALKLVASQ
jgi:hypothetical protein